MAHLAGPVAAAKREKEQKHAALLAEAEQVLVRFELEQGVPRTQVGWMSGARHLCYWSVSASMLIL